MAASVTYLKLSRTLTHSWSTWETSATWCDTLFGFATMIRAKIYGSPSVELQQALDPLGVQYFAHFNGVTR